MQYSKLLGYIGKELNTLSGEPVDICLDSAMAREIEEWGAMYKDKAPWLSANKGIYSAGIPGAVAAEMARLVTLELKSKVEGNDYIDAAYQNALRDIRIQTECGCALGGLVFKPYPVDDRIVVQFIRANGFFPISFDTSGRITKAVFVEQIRAGKKIYTRLEIHSLKDDGLTIENRAYKSNNDETLGANIALTDIEAWADLQESVVFVGVKKLPIGYFKVPMANTIDPESPLGVSVFSRAKGLIEEADKRYSNECWEFEATQAAIHIAESLLKYDKNTDRVQYPAGKERLYRMLSINVGATDAKFIDEFLPEIRHKAIYEGYQAQLKKIEFNCGLAYGTLSDPQVTDKTAEEIRTSKQRSYATVTDIQMALEVALRDLVDAIAFWAKQSGKDTDKYTVSFAWDDSIVVDSNALANRAMLEYTSGIIDRVEYFKTVRGLDEKAAIALEEEIAKRNPPESDPFSKPDGEDE